MKTSIDRGFSIATFDYQRLSPCYLQQVDPSDGTTICNPRDMTSTAGVWSGQCVAGPRKSEAPTPAGQFFGIWF